MIGKIFWVVLLMAYVSVSASSYIGSESYAARLDVIEEIIFEVEMETTDCQMQNGWHFPVHPYNFVSLARQYGNNLKNEGRTGKPD